MKNVVSMPVMDPSTLRDRLRTREDDDGRDAWAGLTLGAVLGCEKRPPPGHINRTLLDIIRDESTGYKDALGQPNNNNKMSWRSFKDRLRIRRAGAAWTSSVPIPASDVPTRSQLSRRQSTRVTMYTTDPPELTETFEESPGAPENPLPVEAVQVHNLRPQFSRNNSIRAPSLTFSRADSTRAPSRTFSRADSTRLHTAVMDGPVVSRRLSAALAEERELQRAESAAALGGDDDEAEEEEEEDEGEREEEGPEAAPRMSLMALLEETDRQAGVVGPTYVLEEEEEDEDEEEEGDSGRGIEYNCCVCMVRHKGAAFIPCGHTFCRLCSRELWVSRGNCPLCNGFILEILDIF
ncbi:hypothetical protein PVL29_009227 [Vitis rotundifolia]|uniref:RING-type domain-containing protein n=1 Tax=Vitis rotundifolia TaxID=103349 RepID=A0AA39DX86_VITRO|nr:hypothetical protein PVL29_009227 [Vitis rotundifolia]